MPLLYKLLAAEVGVPAYLSFAPQHCFVQHPGPGGELMLLETTNRHYTTPTYLLASGYIKAKSVKSGLYMDTLTNRETMAYCLSNLGLFYFRQFGPDDGFVEACVERSLALHPSGVQPHLVQFNVANLRLLRTLKEANLTTVPPPDVLAHFPALQSALKFQQQCAAKLDALGYTYLNPDEYEAWRRKLSDAAESKRQQQILGPTD